MSLGNPNLYDVAQMPEPAEADAPARRINVLLVTSVALSFISFWRAAAIVLCDLASTSFYIGGISEQAVGKAAPWFILAVMLFVYPVTAVYMESCTMFTRGGVYKVVKGAVGGTLAKLSVSALMFDYVLTGPISSVSAAKYLLGLLGDLLLLLTKGSAHPVLFNATTHPEVINGLSVIIAIGITAYFWRANLIGVHESSGKALRIMQLTTVMGVVILLWSGITLLTSHHPPLTVPQLHPVFTQTSLDPGKEPSSGWLEHVPGILGGAGHPDRVRPQPAGHERRGVAGPGEPRDRGPQAAEPAPDGDDHLPLLADPDRQHQLPGRAADPRRQAGHDPGGRQRGRHPRRGRPRPHLAGGRLPPPGRRRPPGRLGLPDEPLGRRPVTPTRTALVIDRRSQHVERDDGGYRDNLINGLVQSLAGPSWLKIAMECLVVVTGFLILAGAVNTSILGSNGVLNRLAEDGVLTPWFQRPHKRFGSSYRLINLVGVLQLGVILFSRGDVNTLGEAYAFGVVWSFVFMTLSMVVLRFKDLVAPAVPGAAERAAEDRQGLVQVPVGTIAVFLVLLSVALVNLATKKTATKWGIGFTAAFMLAFVVAEWFTRRRHGGHDEHLEQFNQRSSDAVSIEALGLTHPNPIIVAARGPRSLPVLQRVLTETDTAKRDVVVITCKVIPAMTMGLTDADRSIDDQDRELLTKIVTVAEEVGKQVHPLVLPTNNPLYAICTAARDLRATEVVLGVSEKVHAEDQLEQFALAWGTATGEMAVGEAVPNLTVRILGPNVEMKFEME